MTKSKPEPAPRKERRLIDLRAVCKKSGDASEATTYRRVADGTLPRPVKYGRLNRWYEDEVDAALEALHRGGPAELQPAVEAPAPAPVPPKRRAGPRAKVVTFVKPKRKAANEVRP